MLGQPIEVRGLEVVGAHASEIAVTLVVTHDHQDVRAYHALGAVCEVVSTAYSLADTRVEG